VEREGMMFEKDFVGYYYGKPVYGNYYAGTATAYFYTGGTCTGGAWPLEVGEYGNEIIEAPSRTYHQSCEYCGRKINIQMEECSGCGAPVGW
jgi:hypothetical protein